MLRMTFSAGRGKAVRLIAVMIGLATALPAVAREMTASEAREFVVGKVFRYTCFDGTDGEARVFPDGSVIGSIRFKSNEGTRYAALPAGTLKVEGAQICASLRGFRPCFYLERTDANSFRGSVAGLGFAYCDFTRQARAHVLSSGPPLQLRPPRPRDAKK
jgi:hypothetical protein